MKHLVFMDLETTGLDADRDVILEAALVVTDTHGNVDSSLKSLIHSDNNLYLMAVNRVLYDPNQYVNKMHQTSGLWDEWNDEDVPHMTPMQFEAEAIKTLMDTGVDYKQAPLAGNSIGSLDRPFLMKHMPELSDFLHYRNFDISTFKMYMQIHRPDVAEEWEEYVKDATSGENAAAHRAMDDALFSVSEYVFYMNHLEKRRKKK